MIGLNRDVRDNLLVILCLLIKNDYIWHFCGNIGYFCSKDEGRYFAYVKDARKMVYIQTTSRGYVISCEQPDQFIEELE